MMLSVVGRPAAGSGQKPADVVRGYASRQPWAWDGLCFAVPFHEGSNEGFRDIANNVAPTEINAVGWTKDDSGSTVANMGNTSYVGWPDFPQHDRPSTAITIYVRLKSVGTSDSWGGIICNFHGTVDPYSTWAIYQESSITGQLSGLLTLNGVRYAWGDASPPPPIPTTEFVNIFIRWVVPGSPNLSVYGNRGNLWSSISSGITDTTGDTLTYVAGKGLRLNATSLLTENFSAWYSQAMVWNRRLSDVEIRSLVSDPYGWYSPRRETLGATGVYAIGASSFMRQAGA